MALALPRLDNRTYDELVREGQRTLPRRAPLWSDHNAHDPGITLIELFSWLVEQDIYRLDRTPDASVRAFLRLVGIEPHPAQVATTVLELAPRPGALDLAAGLAVSDAGGGVALETEAAIHLTGARLIAVAGLVGAARIDHGPENAGPGSTYQPLGANPAVDDALLLGFDAPLGAGGETISLYLWGADPEADADTRRRLIEDRQQRRETSASCPQRRSSDLTDWGQHYSVRTVWEYPSTTGGWAKLNGVEDQTRALSLSGFVHFRVPADHAVGGPLPGLWVVRCRLVSGRYECPPVVDRIGVNTVSARHAALVPAAETLGISSGHAGETYALERGPVVAGSTQLRVALDGAEDDVWHEVANWDRVGPHDRAVRLDSERAEIAFGDGRIGRVPPAGATLSCRYRVGGGSAGNIGACTLVHASDAAVDVRQPFPAFGGAEAETLDDARGRALAFLAERRRAITLSDLETLALSTPGVPVARARALAGHHPSLPCVTAAGNVTLVAVSHCPGERPEAGPDFLAAVHRWLVPLCALTTELHVVGPSYRTVAVRACLHAEAGADPSALGVTATAELDRFLHPLNGGPDGTGWPLGRAVYRSEVLAVLNAIAGVAYIDRLSLLAADGMDASCTNLPLCPDQLAAAGEHRIQVIARRQVR